MTQTSLLAFDIETTPIEGLPDIERDRIPKPIHNRVLAISYTSARVDKTTDKERYFFERCASLGDESTPERDLLREFWSLVDTRRPRLVTWNGRAFDFPVLVSRSMVHGVSCAPWYQTGDRWSSYRSRYSPEWHCDLMDVLSDYGATQRLALDEAAKSLGLPGKMGVEGSQVGLLVKANQISSIRAYCETDTLNLFGIYMRWSFVSGTGDGSSVAAVAQALRNYLTEHRVTRPHLGLFADNWLSPRSIAVL